MANLGAKIPQNKSFTKWLASQPVWGMRGRAGWANQALRGSCGLVLAFCFLHSSLGQAQTIKHCTGGFLTSCERTTNAHPPEIPGLRLIVLEMVFSSDLILSSIEWNQAGDLTVECSSLCSADEDIFQTN